MVPRLWITLLVVCLLGLGCTQRRQSRLLQRAESAFAQEKTQEGIGHLRKIIDLDAESRFAVKAYYRLGFALETYLRDFEGAVLSYEEYIKHSGDVVSIYEVQKRIANIYFQHLLEPDKAVDAYGKLLLLSPDSLEADHFMFRRAQSYFRLNSFGRARKQFQELVEKYPKSQYVAQARYTVGNTYFMQGKYDVAIEALKQVLREHANSEQAVEAQFLMAQCLEHQGRLPNALQLYSALESRYTVPEVLALRIKEVKRRIRAKK